MGYKKLNKFSSVVHIYDFDPRKQRLDLDRGVPGKLEPLSKLGAPKPNERIAAAINWHFFEPNGSAEFYGEYKDDGKTIQGPSTAFPSISFTKANKLVLGTVADSILAASYCVTLVVDGKIDIRNREKFETISGINPRTALGQKADGTIVFCVVDGRWSASKGVTFDYLAKIMYEESCTLAVCGDGGGSSEMMVEGKTVNRPSDGSSRAIGTGLFAYRKILVGLDDGHGMTTAGKRTPKFPDGTWMPENDFNRAVVGLLALDLQEYGFDTLMLAPGDTDISLTARSNLANTYMNGYGYPCDYVLSVHANAMGEDGQWNLAEGISAHILAKGGEAEKIANICMMHLAQGTPLKNRGVVVSNFHMLRETNMPAVLFECAFMTNPYEARLLMTGAYRQECATEIMAGFCEYLGVMYAKKVIQSPESSEEYNKLQAEYDALDKRYKELVSGVDALYKKYSA